MLRAYEFIGDGFYSPTLVTLAERKTQKLLMCRGAIYPQKEQQKVIKPTRRIKQKSPEARLTQQPKSSVSPDAER
ncbi:hypothetical protein TNCV_4631171 [Trichonephila clavipes]|nr:hypothetical protein TNCV_4631171 [Trichonephila clavipes]